MKIWFDADNAPHVPVMRPLAEGLLRMGHRVIFTARNRASTCELLDLYGLEYMKVGGMFGAGTFGKVTGTLKRAGQLASCMRKHRPDVSFGHGSRALPLASRLLGVPSVTMYDYEWVSPWIFNRFCRTILLPEAIGPERCEEAGIRSDIVTRYPGLKEHLYLALREPDPSVAEGLGLRDGALRLLLRPPARSAHYHNPEADSILEELVRLLCDRNDVQVVWLGRDGDPAPSGFIVPQRVYPGPELVMAFDAVIGGGGTMTREASVLGVPSFSFFRGRLGAVDSMLESSGTLSMIRSPGEVAGALGGLKRSRETRRPIRMEDPVPVIVTAIAGTPPGVSASER